MEGLPTDVMDINSEVSDAIDIQEQRKREHREERAEQKSKTVQHTFNVLEKLEPCEKMAKT